MTMNPVVLRSLSRGVAHPSLVLNTLIELDNQKGLPGLQGLEEALQLSSPRLRPSAQPLAQAWLEAVILYRKTYYPRVSMLQLLFRPTLPKAS